MKKREIAFLSLGLIALLVINWLFLRNMLPAEGIQALGMTNFSGLEIDGSETDALIVNQDSTGDIVEFRDADTVVWRLADGGAVTSSGAINQTLVNAASGSANPYDYTGTLGIMNGSDNFTLFDVNITNADHTGSSNVVTALDIAGITADAHATEDAISIGAGWDSDLNFVTSGQVSVDDVALLVLTDPPAPDAATTTEFVEIVATTPVDTTGTNTHNGLTVDLAIGNASGGTNTVNAINIDSISADAQVVERGFNISTGFDTDLNFVTSGQVSVDDAALLVLTDPPAPDAGTTTELVEIVATSPVDTTGTNVHNALTIDLAVGNASGGTNSLRALNVDAITGDAEVTETAINVGTGWDVGLSVGSGGAVVVGDSQYRNSATGSVLLDFRDYADTTDDDMAHALITVNCTDASTGAEDCDYSVGVAEGGAAADTRFSIDADGGVTVGSSANNLVTLTTDSTGDGEVVLPAESVSAGEILNLVRSVPLPLAGWFDCTARTAISVDDGADASPDFTLVNSALTIAYDDTGGSVDTEEICTNFTVPADYASGGTLLFRVTQNAATGANVESIECRLSVDGAAIGTADEDNLADQTAVQTITSAPTGTWAAGAAIGIACKQGNASADDIVYIHSIEGQYTATQ